MYCKLYTFPIDFYCKYYYCKYCYYFRGLSVEVNLQYSIQGCRFLVFFLPTYLLFPSSCLYIPHLSLSMSLFLSLPLSKSKRKASHFFTEQWYRARDVSSVSPLHSPSSFRQVAMMHLMTAVFWSHVCAWMCFNNTFKHTLLMEDSCHSVYVWGVSLQSSHVCMYQCVKLRILKCNKNWQVLYVVLYNILTWL